MRLAPYASRIWACSVLQCVSGARCGRHQSETFMLQHSATHCILQHTTTHYSVGFGRGVCLTCRTCAASVSETSVPSGRAPSIVTLSYKPVTNSLRVTNPTHECMCSRSPSPTSVCHQGGGGGGGGEHGTGSPGGGGGGEFVSGGGGRRRAAVSFC